MDGPFLSFAEQALHYFNREHDGVRREPLATPAAWRGANLAGRDDWIVTLTAADVAEIERALAAVNARNVAMGAMRREDFPLPTLAARVAAWARELTDGRGFLVVRGLPVERWGEGDAARAYWGLGLHLGRPGAQNPENELLGHVVDTGEDATNPYIRRYRTAGDIAYHCDLADVVGLLCLRTAKSGGASRIVSSISVYNELLRRRPDLVARLYEPFRLDRRDDFRSAVRHPDVPPFTEEERSLLDLYEGIANEPDLYLDMQFAPGDIQLVSNHFILHARTAYEDHVDPARKRHLLRLWLSLM
jgi:hypothetical protein